MDLEKDNGFSDFFDDLEETNNEIQQLKAAEAKSPPARPATRPAARPGTAPVRPGTPLAGTSGRPPVRTAGASGAPGSRPPQPGTRLPQQTGTRPPQAGARPPQAGTPGSRPPQPGTRPPQPGTRPPQQGASGARTLQAGGRPPQPGVRPPQPGSQPGTNRLSKQPQSSAKTLSQTMANSQSYQTQNKTPVKESKPVGKNALILYIIIDKPVFGMINYLRESGLNVSTIFTDMTEAKNTILMQNDPLRLVIVDTGTGKFTTTTMRAEIVDMLGVSDEENRTTVFYTDSVIKMETIKTLGKGGKAIDWQKYQSTAVMVATLLSYKEQYKYESPDDNDVPSVEEVLNFKGVKLDAPESDRMTSTGFSSDAIMNYMVNNADGALEKFKMRF